MTHSNLDIINKFIHAYTKGDTNELKEVLSEKVIWTFPGRNPLSGRKVGVEEVTAFFYELEELMRKSNAKLERLVIGANDSYVLECLEMRTNENEIIDLDQHMCILWVFEDGKIIEGKHFTANQYKIDGFFNVII